MPFCHASVLELEICSESCSSLTCVFLHLIQVKEEARDLKAMQEKRSGVQLKPFEVKWIKRDP